MRPSSSEYRGSAEAVRRMLVLKHEQALTRPSVGGSWESRECWKGCSRGTETHDILHVCDNARDSPACCPAGPGVFVSM